MVKWVDGKIFKWGALVERKSDSGLIGVRRNQDNVVECGIIWHNSGSVSNFKFQGLNIGAIK